MSLRIFVSSVQTEFAEERRRLAEYIRSDALLADFFDVFLFEEQPAPEFDPAAGTFRTVIWRSGYGPRNLRGGESGFKSTGCGKCPSRGRVGVESQGRAIGMSGASQGLVKGASQGLVKGASRGFLCVLESLRGAVEKSSTEIAGSFGKTRANSYIKRLISVMIDDDMLEPTGVRKKGARLQKYRLTVKGRRLVAKLTKG